MNALLSKNCWATIQAMNCLLSSGSTIQENKVGLPWMILATKQISGPSPWETVKKSSKTATRQRLRALAKAYPTFLSDLYQGQGATGDH